MEYSLSITPGISPAARHQLEDKLDGFFTRYGGEVTGGGTMLDGSESDLDFECEQDGFENDLKAFLVQHANINATITLKTLEDSLTVFAVECSQDKQWWRFW